jgi:preprotein translocase subunit SecF
MFNIYNKNVPFLKYYKSFYILSLVLIIISFFSLFSKGLNLGIDFKGGTVIEMQFNKEFSANKIRQGLLSQNLGDVKVKEFGSNKSFLAVLEKKSGESNFIPSIKSNL